MATHRGFSLGAVIRGRRLGYAILPSRVVTEVSDTGEVVDVVLPPVAQMRLVVLQDGGDGTDGRPVGAGLRLRVDLCPRGVTPDTEWGGGGGGRGKRGVLHVVWWECSLDEQRAVVEALPWCVRYTRVLKRPVSFVVDEHGTIVP